MLMMWMSNASVPKKSEGTIARHVIGDLLATLVWFVTNRSICKTECAWTHVTAAGLLLGLALLDAHASKERENEREVCLMS